MVRHLNGKEEKQKLVREVRPETWGAGPQTLGVKGSLPGSLVLNATQVAATQPPHQSSEQETRRPAHREFPTQIELCCNNTGLRCAVRTSRDHAAWNLKFPPFRPRVFPKKGLPLLRVSDFHQWLDSSSGSQLSGPLNTVPQIVTQS